MLQKQGQIAIQFKQMQSAISQDHHFSAGEVSSMSNTLTNIVSESARNISMLELAIKSLVTQMHDADRLRIIDAAGDGIDKNYADLQQFYQRSLLLSLERAQDQNDVAATKGLYNIQ
jgi:predicted outer membrane protein